LFLFQPWGNTGVALLIVSWWGWSYYYYRARSSAKASVGIIGGGIALISSLAVVNVDSEYKALGIVALYLASWVIMIYSLVKGVGPAGLIETVYAYWWLGWEYIRAIFRMIFVALGVRKATVVRSVKVKNETSKSVVTGVLIGIPVVAWLVMLLSRADVVYAEFVKNLVSARLLSELPGRIVISLVLLMILSPLLALTWRKYRSPVSGLRGKWGGEILVVTMMVVAVVGSFLVVQWPYVFAKVAQEIDLSQFGVATYSEYVQRGFVELIQVVGIGYLVGWAGYLTLPGGKEKLRRWLLLAQSVLGVEMLIFVASIMRRVLLYQSFHGLSLARMYGSMFLIWLVGMGVALIGRYLRPGWRWIRMEGVWIGVVVVATIGANFEGRVVKNPPTVNKRVDYVYLSQMPADGYMGWGSALDNTEAKLAEMVAQKPTKLDSEQRRELYYAGLVLQMTALHKDQLTWRYGSSEEVRAYMKTVVAGEKSMIEKYSNFANYYAGRSVQEYRANLEKAVSQLEGNEWEKVWVMINYPHYNSGTYTFSRYDQNFYSIHADWPGADSRPSSWGKWLASNMSERRAYQWISKEVPMERLQKAMSQYWQLKEVVMQQPEEDRRLEVDIAPNGMGWR